MAIVINEFEAVSEPAAPQPAQTGRESGPATPDIRQIASELAWLAQRTERLDDA
jgi:hypothetical protein